ncbi:uncharacterized protein [Coffea arabica]|uniref:Integrase catalytic domain-containing protein n=1 Tax=Coffea arabica TaxID=13443 RepID=A0ABM4VH91_COFAR
MNQRLHIGSDNSKTARKETSKILVPNPSKIDLPMFTGENPREWIRKCNKYCLNYQTPEDQKVEVIEIYLEEKADNWFQGIKLEQPGMTWSVFEELLYRRFDSRNGRDVVEEFNKLRQSGKIEEYQERFEELKTLMMVRNPYLDKEYYVSSFISGLKDEIRTMIKMLRPMNLSEAFELAALQEEALRLQTRTYKEGGKAASENSHLNLLVTDEEEEIEFEDAVGEQDESTGNPGQVMEMSLHALSEAMKRKIVTLIGKWDGEEMLILVDTGSSDTYISSEKVIAFDIPYQLVEPFSVIIGNGAFVTSKAICPKVTWGINQHQFCFDLKLTISLYNQGEVVQLRGQVENCNLDLIRGKDLRHFVEYKKQMCLALRMEQQKLLEEPMVFAEVQQIIEDFKDVFQTPTELPPTREIDHWIPLKQGSQAFKMKPYRYPHSQKGEIERQILQPYLRKFALVFFDDILIYNSTIELHLEHLRIVLTVSRKHRLFAKKSKCLFAQQKVDYLGHTITENEVSMDQSKIESINYSGRTTLFGIREHRRPLTMCQAPVLRLPDFRMTFTIEIDASSGGIGAVLMQEGHPIAFLSKALSPRNLGLSAYEKDLLALQGSCLVITSVTPLWIQELQRSYDVDPQCQSIISQRVLDPTSQSQYEWDQGLLKYSGKLYVGATNGLSEKLIQALHASAIGGHSGQKGCWQRLKALFYWPNMKQDVIKYIQACDTCQRFKSEHVPYPGLLQPLPVPHLAWTHLTMDFIESLLESQGYDTVLVIIDRLTKVGHSLALAHPFTAKQVAQLFLENIFKLHGIPASIVTDRDRIFTSAF